MPEHVERFEIAVGATLEEVWRCLTTSEGLASWFGTSAQADLSEGLRIVSWSEEAMIEGRFSEVEPLRRLRVVYMEGDKEVGAEEWLLANEESTTRITLITSMPTEGIEDWEDYFGDIRRGWNIFLASLKFALETALTPSRRARHTAIPATGDRQLIWPRLVEIAGMPLAEGMSERLVDPPHSLFMTRPDRSILLDIEGSDENQVIYFQVACHGPGDDTWMEHALSAAHQLATARPDD
jgi:uncharacterized protein YndB with AHSA1/START domain